MAEHDVAREAFDEGYTAYGSGEGLDTCPYHDGSSGWSYWYSGWYEAEADAIPGIYISDLTDYNDEGDAA